MIATPSRRALLLAGAAALPLAAACGVSTRQPSGRRSLRLGWTSDIDTLNPLTAVTSEAVEVLQLVYDKLFEYDLDLKPEPCLATSSTTSADGLSITYALRSGVRWHDGKPFTAADVVATFDLIHKHNLGQNAQYLVDMTGVTASGDTSVTVSFSKPQAFDPALVIPIVPAHVWSGFTAGAAQKFRNAAAVGTGPYKLGTWKRGQRVEVVRNAAWWGSKPAPARVTWQLYSNDDVMAQGLKNGDVDFVLQAPPTVYDGLRSTSGITTASMKSFSFHHIGFNVSSSPKSKGNPLLRDKSVRQALSCAVSRQQLVNLALAGHGVPGSVLLPAAFGEYQYQVPDADRLDNNPTKAAQLLDAAGYTAGSDGIRRSKDGAKLSFRLIAIADTSVDVRAAQLFQQAAKKVGISLALTTLDSNTLSDTVYNNDDPDWDIFVWGWDSGTADPSYLLGVPLTSQIGSNNDVFYSNPAYDALYQQQATTLDHASRVQLVHQMQQLYYDDCAYIVMWYQDKLQAYRPSAWTGWRQVPGGMVFNFTRDNYLHVKAG